SPTSFSACMVRLSPRNAHAPCRSRPARSSVCARHPCRPAPATLLGGIHFSRILRLARRGERSGRQNVPNRATRRLVVSPPPEKTRPSRALLLPPSVLSDATATYSKAVQ